VAKTARSQGEDRFKVKTANSVSLKRRTQEEGGRSGVFLKGKRQFKVQLRDSRIFTHSTGKENTVISLEGRGQHLRRKNSSVPRKLLRSESGLIGQAKGGPLGDRYSVEEQKGRLEKCRGVIQLNRGYHMEKNQRRHHKKKMKSSRHSGDPAACCRS